MILSFVRALISAFKARRELALKNVTLRQQLAVLHRSVKRPRLSNVDREFWVLLRRIWIDWESVLVIVKPETVVRWLWSAKRKPDQKQPTMAGLKRAINAGSIFCGAHLCARQI